MEGWVTLHRKFLQWEWFDKAEMVQLFVWLLLNASHTDRKWQGQVVKRGQILTTTPKIMEALNLSAQQTRTCIGRLKSTGEITCKSTNKYTIITICNYDRYQSDNFENNRQNNGQTNTPATDKQRTNNGHNNNNNVIIKQLNNNISVCSNSAHTREEKERDEIFKIFFFKNFLLPAYEVERFYNHYEAQGWDRGNGQKIKNKIAAARNWEQENKTQRRFPDAFVQAMREICAKLDADQATCVLRAIDRIEVDAQNIRLVLNAPVHEIIDVYVDFLKMYTGRKVRYSVKRTN
jgi:hypothetical protein